MRNLNTRLLFTSILLICGTGLFAQAPRTSIKDDPNIIFIRVEVNPSFKDGIEALNKYLTKKINTAGADDGEEGTVYFIVSKTGTIDNIQRISGNLSFENALKRAILKSSGMWNSALQNNNPVTALCKLKITFQNNSIQAEIL